MAKLDNGEKLGKYQTDIVDPKTGETRRVIRSRRTSNNPSIGSRAEALTVFGIKPEPSEAPIPQNEAAPMNSTSSSSSSSSSFMFSSLSSPITPPPSLSLSSDDSLPSTDYGDPSPERLDAPELEVSKKDNKLDNSASPPSAPFQPQRLPQPPTLLQNARGLITRPSLTFGVTLGIGLFLTGFGLPVAALAFAGSLGGIEIFRKIRETQSKSAITKTETEASTQSISTNDAEPDVTLLPEYGLELGSSSLLFGKSPSRSPSHSPSLTSSPSSSSCSSSSSLSSTLSVKM